jgi:arylsulfatase A-like enzyme
VSILERRRWLRRALAGGVVLGAAAGAVCATIECAWVLVTAGASFDGVGEAARFFALTVMLLVGGGALAGVAQGLVMAAVAAASRALQSRRADAAGWRAMLYTAVAAPPIALGCAQIFAGPRARLIPHHDVYALAIGIVALGTIFLLARAWQRLATALSDGRSRPLLISSVMTLVALLFHAVDQRVLYRLYPFFHLGLHVLTFAAAELAVAVAYRGSNRRWSRLVAPAWALAIGCVSLSGGALAAKAIAHERALRTIILERTTLAAPLVRLTRRGEPQNPRATVAATRTLLPEGPRLNTPDLFLITVDAMRNDRLDARTAPFLSSLAAEGVRFDHAYAQVPHTSFSIATLLTGKFVYSLSQLGLDAAGHQTLAEVMKRERYKTAAFYPPSVFTIDHERLKNLEDSRYGFEYVKYEFMDAPGRTDQVIHFLEAEHPAHAFVWVHYFDPHEPYEPHPGPFAGAKTAIDRYDGEVRFADTEIARLVAYVKKTRPHALLVIAADHGEEFGEHGGHYHGTTLYEEQVRVPLVFTTLDGALAPALVHAPVGLVDVAPTLLALAGITPSARMRGHDLGPWLLPAARRPGDEARGPVFAEIDRQKMIVDGDHKLICDLGSDSCSAFDLAHDPGERKNRIDEPFAATLRTRLDEWMATEMRYEDLGMGGDARARRALEAARLGEKSAAPELAAILRAPDVSLHAEAARLLCQLAPDPATREPLAAAAARSDEPEPVRRFAELGLLRLGDTTARAPVTRELARRCANITAEDEPYCARAALALGDVPALARALEQAGDDEALAIALIAALGHSHDPRALDPLTLALGGVRTRLQTVQALLELDDPRLLPHLLMWLPNEPYIPVRAKMVTLVAQLARQDPAAARATLKQLAAVEREAPVVAALAPALASLGDAGAIDLGRARAVALAGGELWLVGSGSGTFALGIGGATRQLVMTNGVAHAITPRGGPVSLKLVAGEARARYALIRRAP